MTSKPAAIPTDAAKKNWFSSVTALSPLSKPRSGSIIGEAPPPSVQSARSATPAAATPPNSSSPLSSMSASPSKTRVAPATLGRSSGSGSIPGSPEGEASGGATRSEKEAAYSADGVKWCEAGVNDIRVKCVIDLFACVDLG